MLAILRLLPLLSLAAAFECSFTANGVSYDLNPLGNVRTASSRTDTPPTQSEARLRMALCGDGVGREDGLADEDQCPSDSKVCLKLVNIKGSDERITSVIPIWTNDVTSDRIWTEPIGNGGSGGVDITVNGPEYGGTPQTLKLTLHCDTSATAENPTFSSYTAGVLALEWATPDACPRGNDEKDDGGSSDDGSGESSVSGWGFFGFLKFVFWMGLFGLLIYFAVGIFYNHQQYSARGWDLVPHRDFWREFPALVKDLVGHVFSNVRGGGSRGGYNTLG